MTDKQLERGITLKLSYDEADNLASILLSDASQSARERQKYQREKKKDSNTKSIIALMKQIEKMECAIAKRIYGELTALKKEFAKL